MLIPSLTLLLCLAAPLVALLHARHTPAAYRTFAITSVPLWIAAALAAGTDANSVLNTSSLMGSLHITPDPLLYMISAAPLLVFALLFWLLRARALPAATPWLAAPLGCLALGISLAHFALPYLTGMLKWSYAALPVKAAGIFGCLCIVLALLSALALCGVIIISLLRTRRA